VTPAGGLHNAVVVIEGAICADTIILVLGLKGYNPGLLAVEVQIVVPESEDFPMLLICM
jgi:hypothetical protein